MKTKYKIESKPDEPGIIQLLDDKIYEYNSNRLQQYDGHLFSKLVRDKTDEVIGGIAGWTWAGACEVTLLWVHKNMRGNGIGKMLLHAAEQEAKNTGCVMILIRSYSFQAPEFYKKNGYKVESVLDGFPTGYSYYTLTKALPRE
jgi:GNAT superfamily N-acetyltransferase